MTDASQYGGVTRWDPGVGGPGTQRSRWKRVRFSSRTAPPLSFCGSRWAVPAGTVPASGGFRVDAAQVACATAGHHVPWESLIAARVAELWGPRGVLLIKREAERRIPVEGAQWGRRGAGSAWLPARPLPELSRAPLILTLYHTHTHSHTHVVIRPHALTRSQYSHTHNALTHSQCHTHPHAPTHYHTQSHALTHPNKLTRSPMRIHKLTYSLAPSHRHTDAHSHSHAASGTF